MRNLPAILGYVLVVLSGTSSSPTSLSPVSCCSNPTASLQPAWITVPLDLNTPEAITVLAGTITLTPGTVTADLAADGRALLVHCLHAPDPDSVRDEIKSRYEARLMRIFE